MATLLNSHIIAEQYKDTLENSGEVKEKEVSISKPVYKMFPEDYQSVEDVLKFAEIKNAQNTAMLLRQTISAQYKEVSEVLDSIETKKRNTRKKGLRELMQQSFFHGANWMGSNFIA